MAVVPRLVVALLAVGCSSAPPKPPAPPVAAPAPGPLSVTWIVADHVLVKGASISTENAAGFHGRTIDISDAGFMSPWQGTCAHAQRTEHPRSLDEVVAELGVVASDRAKVEAFGFTSPTTEYRLACDEGAKTPLTILVGGEKAMTCYGGACYLLNQF